MSDVTWRDQGDPDEHADVVQAASDRTARAGDYDNAAALDVAAQAIRGLGTALAAAHERIEALKAERDRWIRLASGAHDALELTEPNHPATRALDDAIDQIDVVTLAVALRTADEENTHG
jgi:hypothetical protein